MSDAFKEPTSRGLVDRAKAILLNPAEEWPKIAIDTKSTSELFTGYVLPLVLIGPIALIIGLSVVGVSTGYMHKVLPFGFSLTIAVSGLVLELMGFGILVAIANLTAPNFGGESNKTNAFKLIAFSSTPGWVASCLAIIPPLASLIEIISLYGVYIAFLGSTILMKIPKEKNVAFIAILILISAIFSIVLTLIQKSML